MPEVVRLGDSHSGSCGHGDLCCDHGVSGTYVEGSDNVFVNNLPVVRVGDALVHSCPHCGTGSAASGSSSVFVNGIAVHRVGDSVVYGGGGGTANSGSENVYSG